MAVEIAIPIPTSEDKEYNLRALPQYIQALEAVGTTAIVIPLNESQAHVARMLESVQGVLLPGSRFDVDPQRYGEHAIPECGPKDEARTAVDELLLQDAFNLKKPILGICQGLQSLNVWRNGSLVQHLRTAVNHTPGREVAKAHPVRIADGSRLKGLAASGGEPDAEVNSSHHQAIHTPGDNLLVSAVSPIDGVIEAVELDSPEHFVLAVQWHPERTYSESAFSRAIFFAFAEAAKAWQPPRIEASVVR